MPMDLSGLDILLILVSMQEDYLQVFSMCLDVMQLTETQRLNVIYNLLILRPDLYVRIVKEYFTSETLDR